MIKKLFIIISLFCLPVFAFATENIPTDESLYKLLPKNFKELLYLADHESLNWINYNFFSQEKNVIKANCDIINFDPFDKNSWLDNGLDVSKPICYFTQKKEHSANSKNQTIIIPIVDEKKVYKLFWDLSTESLEIDENQIKAIKFNDSIIYKFEDDLFLNFRNNRAIFSSDFDYLKKIIAKNDFVSSDNLNFKSDIFLQTNVLNKQSLSKKGIVEFFNLKDLSSTKLKISKYYKKIFYPELENCLTFLNFEKVNFKNFDSKLLISFNGANLYNLAKKPEYNAYNSVLSQFLKMNKQLSVMLNIDVEKHFYPYFGNYLALYQRDKANQNFDLGDLIFYIPITDEKVSSALNKRLAQFISANENSKFKKLDLIKNKLVFSFFSKQIKGNLFCTENGKGLIFANSEAALKEGVLIFKNPLLPKISQTKNFMTGNFDFRKHNLFNFLLLKKMVSRYPFLKVNVNNLATLSLNGSFNDQAMIVDVLESYKSKPTKMKEVNQNKTKKILQKGTKSSSDESVEKKSEEK